MLMQSMLFHRIPLSTCAAYPSGLDATAWHRLCCSFKSASVTLCSALAAVGHRICIEAVHPNGLTAFVACRLIPFDSNLVSVLLM